MIVWPIVADLLAVSWSDRGSGCLPVARSDDNTSLWLNTSLKNRPDLSGRIEIASRRKKPIYTDTSSYKIFFAPSQSRKKRKLSVENSSTYAGDICTCSRLDKLDVKDNLLYNS